MVFIMSIDPIKTLYNYPPKIQNRVKTLKGNDEDVKTVTLNEENNWTATVKELPKKANGKDIVYIWVEDETGLPEEYEITSETTFMINEEGIVTTTGKMIIDNEGKSILLVQDSKIPNKIIKKKPTKNPNTADHYNLYLSLLSLFISGFATSLLYLRKLNNAE